MRREILKLDDQLDYIIDEIENDSGCDAKGRT